MPRARLVKASAPAPIYGQHTVVRMVSGTMGAAGDPGPTPALGPPKPEPEPVAASDHDAWSAEVARREAAQGIARDVAPPAEQSVPRQDDPRQVVPGGITFGPRWPTLYDQQPAPDLSALPERFALEIQRLPGDWWKVTAPGVHVGLFVARQDLAEALVEVPAALAEIVRLDGSAPQPKTRVRRKVK